LQLVDPDLIKYAHAVQRRIGRSGAASVSFSALFAVNTMNSIQT